MDQIGRVRRSQDRSATLKALDSLHVSKHADVVDYAKGSETLQIPLVHVAFLYLSNAWGCCTSILNPLRHTGHLSRLLRDRELIVRSDGRLHYLRLSREWHITLAATGIGLGAYMLAATIGLVWQDLDLASGERKIQEQRLGQLELLSEMRELASRDAVTRAEIQATLGTLAQLRDAHAEVAAARERLDRELQRAEARLSEFSEIQNAVVQRLTERMLIGMDMIERVVAMTDLNINDLVHGMEIEDLGLARGGPFVPDDYLIADDTQLKFQTSVVLLDQQIARWKALQEVVRTIPLVSPLDQYRMTSGFGRRVDPINGREAAHYGVDLKAPMGTPVMATAPGTVVFVGWKGHFGRLVEIDHGNGIRTRYGHLRKILVEPGQELSHREEVGLLGSSGRSTGPHVHYEILVDDEPRDPTDFMTAGHYAFKG